MTNRACPYPGATPSLPGRIKLLVIILFLGGVFLCLASLVLACSFGALSLPPADVFAALAFPFCGLPLPSETTATTPEGVTRVLDGETLRLVVVNMRLFRALLAFCAGAGLAVAGVVFQSILRNPLADPFTLGVSGGAAFGAALTISLGLTGAFMGFGLPLAAFAGAAATLFVVLMLARIGGGLKHETLILAGVVASAFLAALISLIKALDEASVTGIVFWIMGSFQGRGKQELLLLLPGCVVGCCVALALARELDVLSLGDRAARYLGLNVARLRLVLLLATGAIVASCVAVSGIIGFVGLIVPHLCRMLLGAKHKLLLPAGALTGGLLLLWSDVAARSVFPGGVELPVGVITALLGGPFFCFLLGKKQGNPVSTPLLDTALSLPKPDCWKLPPQEGTAHAKGYARAGDLVCENLSFTYGKAGTRGEGATLKNIAFTLRQGEFTALLGPNGSGKSTLLHCLAGVLRPDSGKALVAGRDSARLRDRERALLLAGLQQQPESVPALSVFAVTLMGRYARTSPVADYTAMDRQSAMNALEETGASHLAGRAVNSLSGGELQRVLLARTLAQGAPLLLLDEVTAGLDPFYQTTVLDILTRKNHQEGVSIIMAIHDLNLAALYCRRLIFLKKGRIVADGPTEEVFTPQILTAIYETSVTLLPHPRNGRPQALLLPHETVAFARSHTFPG